MILFSIPNKDGEVRQSNRSEVGGEIISSYNLDLSSSPGKVKTSKKLSRILSYANLGNSEIVDITQSSDKRYLLTGDNVYESELSADPTTGGNWTETTEVTDALSLTNTTAGSFGGALIIADTTNLHRLTVGGSYTSNWWTGTISGPSLSSNAVHVLHTHRGGQETLFVTDGDEVHYYNATAGHSTVTLDPSLTAISINSGVSAVWVGTYAASGEKASVYEIYVGEELASVPVARNAYPINARGVFAIAVHNNTPYIINELGELQVFNGVGFSTVAELPFVSETNRVYGAAPGDSYGVNERPVNPNGMKVHGDSIFLYASTRDSISDDPINERAQTGIWEYNTRTGQLNHRFSTANSSAEYGETSTDRIGPLFIDATFDSFILAGGGSATDTDAGLFGYTGGTPSSYFVTPEIERSTPTESFDRITIKAKTMQSGESVTVKYRVSKNPDYPQYNDITWTAATTFTTTDASFTNVSVGDEIEVVNGYGAGHIAHVTAISFSTPTYTVTIDKSVGSNTQTARLRVQNWIKINDPYTSDDGEFKIIGINKVAPWIQFKVVMVGDIELRSFVVSNQK